MSVTTLTPSTIVTYPLTGQTEFNVPFEYLARRFVVVTLIGVGRKILTLNTDYRFVNKSTILLNSPTGSDFDKIELRRKTDVNRLVDYHDGSILRALDMNTSQIQSLHIAEEARNAVSVDGMGITDDGNLDARGKRIVNVAYAQLDTDAVPLGQIKEMDKNAFESAEEAKETLEQTKLVKAEIEAELQTLRSTERIITEFGVAPNTGVDNSVAIRNAVEYCAKNGITLVWPAGKYLSSRFKVEGAYHNYKWRASGKVLIKSLDSEPLGPSWDADYFIRLAGGPANELTLTETLNAGQSLCKVKETTGVAVGDIIRVRSNRLIQTDNRGQAREGQNFLAASVSATSIGLDNNSYFYLPTGSVLTGTVSQVTSADKFQMNGLSLNVRYNQLRITGKTGANAGVVRFITKWDTKTFEAEIAGRQSPFPNQPVVGDTFEISSVSTVYRQAPCFVDIEGDFTITRDRTLNAVAGSLGFRGITISSSVRPTLKGITIDGFSETGLYLIGCLYHNIDNIKVDYANRSYNGWDGTGYGISVYQSSYGIIQNTRHFGCRRAVDISGGQEVSLFNKVQGVSVAGGGVAYDGSTAFWPTGTALNSGIGSHGAGYETTYEGCTLVDVANPISVRGLNEVITGNTIRGFVRENVVLVQYFGGGVTITNNHYEDGFTEGTNDSSYRYKAVLGEYRGKRPWAFCDITLATTKGYYSQLPVTIMGNTVRAVRKGFLRFVEPSSGVSIRNIYLGNNICILDPEEGTTMGTQARFMYAVTGSVTPLTQNVHDLGGNRMVMSGTNKYTDFGMYNYSKAFSGILHLPNNTWVVKIPAGKAMRIPVCTTTANIEVTVKDLDRINRYSMISGLIHKNEGVDHSALKDYNKRDFVVHGTTLSDGQGDASKMNMSYMSDGYIYLSNRLDFETVTCITVSGAL